MTACVTAEISASAIIHNVSVIRQGLDRNVKLCAVVKADCYGHGLGVLLPTILPHVDALAVATASEAMAVRTLDRRVPLLVFFTPSALEGGNVQDELVELIRREVILSVVSPAEIAALSKAAVAAGRKAAVHVKVDTGMGRSGVLPERFPELLEAIHAGGGVSLCGVYTHLPVADEANWAYSAMQLDRLKACAALCVGAGTIIRHAANSAAAMAFSDSHLDMVRPGLAVYGYRSMENCSAQDLLSPALRLTSPLMQIKDVVAGTRCGYGLTYEMPAAGRIGLVPIGYADGYFRSLSNCASVGVRGKYARVLGRVSMDQIIVDLTDIPGAAVGDIVEIISPDRTAPNSVESLAKLAGTIPYEIIVRLGARIRRVLVA